VQFELIATSRINWVPVIEKDVDGPGSLPLRMDGEVPNLGNLPPAGAVARTIYLGSAPAHQAAHRGWKTARQAGLCHAGRIAAVFGDALRRLAGAATYLYQDGSASVFHPAHRPSWPKIARTS
jgi:hypothetical protein